MLAELNSLGPICSAEERATTSSLRLVSAFEPHRDIFLPLARQALTERLLDLTLLEFKTHIIERPVYPSKMQTAQPDTPDSMATMFEVSYGSHNASNAQSHTSTTTSAPALEIL
jgi:hypothetical protein